MKKKMWQILLFGKPMIKKWTDQIDGMHDLLYQPLKLDRFHMETEKQNEVCEIYIMNEYHKTE
jgi:hypothetical protein